jgi:glycosyltransferase involved in cell wall biosynthesis
MLINDDPAVAETRTAAAASMPGARRAPSAKAGGSDAKPAGRERLLHVFSGFGAGGVPIRMTDVFNHLGPRYRHVIVSLDGDLKAVDRLAGNVPFSVLDTPKRSGNVVRSLARVVPALARLHPHLLLTYNWGAIEWALANRLLPDIPHIHFESGFGAEEARAQIRRRVLFRRIALAAAQRIVVPSRSLLAVARDVWRIDPKLIEYIPNGVDCERFDCPPDRGAIPGLQIAPGELVVGTVAPLRPEKNLSRLVMVFAGLAPCFNARLVLVGDGQERARLEALCRELNVRERVVFAGYVARPERVLGLFDVFVLSSDTEQMPNALLQAMAAGRAIAATDVGDVRVIVAPDNHPYVTPLGDDDTLRAAIEALLRDPALRAALGARNRAHVRDTYPMARFFRAYEALFEAALGAA